MYKKENCQRKKHTIIWYKVSGGNLINILGMEPMMLVSGERMFVEDIIVEGIWRTERVGYLGNLHDEIDIIKIDEDGDFWTCVGEKKGNFILKSVIETIRTRHEQTT